MALFLFDLLYPENQAWLAYRNLFQRPRSKMNDRLCITELFYSSSIFFKTLRLILLSFEPIPFLFFIQLSVFMARSNLFHPAHNQIDLMQVIVTRNASSRLIDYLKILITADYFILINCSMNSLGIFDSNHFKLNV